MSCTQPDLNRLESSVTPTGGAGGPVGQITSPYLIVSNEPETITSAKLGSPVKPLTLYKGTIPFTGTQRIRLFLWHLNDFPGSNLLFQFLVHGDGDATVDSIKRSVENVPFTDASVPGICLAKAQLYDTLDPVSGSINVGTTETELWSATVSYGTREQLIGVVMEFDVEGTGDSPATKLNVRTLCTPSTSVGLWSDDPPDPETPQHVRGWWPKSSINVKLNADVDGTFDVNPVTNNVAQTGVCESGGPEHGPEGFAAIDDPVEHPFDLTNKGCYGVDLEYYCPLKNDSTTEPGKCFVGMISHDIGPKYWGAAHISDPAQPETGVKKMPEPVETDPSDPGHAVDLLEADPDTAINIGPEGTDDVRIRLANGGAAATPVYIVLSNEPVLAEPLGGPL